MQLHYWSVPGVLRTSNVDMIRQQCAEVFGITVEELLSASRKMQAVFARHACVYLLKTQYGFPAAHIAACINRRQRGTVLNAFRQAQDLLATNRYFKKNYDEVCKRIGLGFVYDKHTKIA